MKALLFLLPLLCLGSLAGCAKAKPQFDQKIFQTNWQCDSSNPADTIIQVTLAMSGTACKASIVKPEGAPENPRACVGRKVIWFVTNNCTHKDRVLVTFGFNPFTKDVEKYVGKGDSKSISSRPIRKNARVTTETSPAYKYDILLDEVIDQDPEIEIEGI